MIRKILISILLTTSLLAGSCFFPTIGYRSKIPDREVIRKLSTQNAGHAGWEFVENQYADAPSTVSYKPLTEKPVIQWKRSVELRLLIMAPGMLVDRNGCVWYCADDLNSIPTEQTIMRLNPDGSEDQIASMDCFTDIFPVLAMSEAVLFLGNRFDNNKAALICYNLSGEQAWRSDTFRYDEFIALSRRSSGNRIIIPIDGRNSGSFAIFSLLDGEKLETLHFENWSGEYVTKLPFELKNGEWLGFERDNVVKYDKYLDPVWKYSINDELTEMKDIMGGESVPGFSDEDIDDIGHELSCYPVVSLADNSVMVGQIHKYAAIDLNTGTEKWTIDKIGNPCPTNLTVKNNSIVYGDLSVFNKMPFEKYTNSYGEGGRILYPTMGTKVMCIGPNGEGIWAVPLEEMAPFPMSDPVCYPDGSLLFGSSQGLTMVSSEGDVLWRIPLDELGAKSDMDMWNCTVLPSPDNRIIFGIPHHGMDSNFEIISFELPKGDQYSS